jgi:ribosomal protein S18 acetylase RimI-like enzyme
MHRAGYGISILKYYWNMGIGTMLTEYCLEKAKEIGYEQIKLSVLKDNTGATNIYEKMDLSYVEYHVLSGLLALIFTIRKL